MRILIAHTVSDFRGFNVVAAEHLPGLFHAQVCQVFNESAAGFLRKNRAEMIWAQIDALGGRIQGNFLVGVIFADVLFGIRYEPAITLGCFIVAHHKGLADDFCHASFCLLHRRQRRGYCVDVTDLFPNIFFAVPDLPKKCHRAEIKIHGTLVVVFEQNLYLFKAMLYYFDLSPIMETQKIVFFIGDSSYFKRAFEELFFSMLFFSTTYPTTVFTLPAARNFKNEYMEIHRFVFNELTFLMSCIGNSHQDNMIGLQNLVANTKEILKNPYASCLEGKYRNVPAFIISNGPSLDISMPMLKEIQGKGLMIAVESAIVPLAKNGIVPDILVVVERTKYTYLYHFQDRNYSPDIVLLALAIADPRVFPSFAGEKIPVFRKGEDLNRWFNQILGDGSALDAGANVSHLAAGTAMHLGADPIILVGQDFAYGPGGVTHSRDAVASQEKGERARKLLHSIPTVSVEGNNGEMILSNRLWDNFRQGLEHMIEVHPEHHFYNATEGGAKIHGTERAELGQLIEQYCTEPIPCRVNELILKNKALVSAAERRTRLEKLIAAVGRYADSFRSLANETNLKKLECEKMMLLCAAEDHEKYYSILDETYQKNITSFYQYADDNLCRYFFQQLNCTYFHLLDRMGTIDTPKKTAQAFSIQMNRTVASDYSKQYCL